jgi:Tfp pilus assembly protein PilN
MIDVNVLPAQYRKAVISLRQTLLALGGITVLAVLGVLFMALSAAQEQTAAKEAELAQNKAALANTPANTVDVTTLQKQIDEMRIAAAQLRAESQSLSADLPSRTEGLARAIQLVSPGVVLTSITNNGSIYQVSGQAGSQTIVLDYANTLKKSNTWRIVRVVSMLNTDPLGIAPDVNFMIEMTQ